MAEQNEVLSRSIVESTVYKAINKLGFSSLKPQQMMAISAFIEQRDVFVVLPTGFGKTLCFTCLPIVFDELYPSIKPSIVLVVTPLIAIMQDQVSSIHLLYLLSKHVHVYCQSMAYNFIRLFLSLLITNNAIHFRLQI